MIRHRCDANTSDSYSRRRVIAYGSGGIGLVFAGCLGDGGDDGADGVDSDGSGDDDDGDGVSDDSAGEPVVDTIVGYINRFPDEIHYNTLIPGGLNEDHKSLMFGWFACMDAEQNYQFVLGDGWDIPEPVREGDEITIQIRDDLYYHDGTPVDAERFVDHITVLNALDGHTGDAITAFDQPEVVDDTTLTVTAQEPGSPSIFQDIIAELNADYGSELHQPYVEQLRDATTSDEIDDIAVEYLDDHFEEAVGAGPWQLEEAQSSHLLLSRHEDYPEEYQTNIPFMRLENLGDEYLRGIQTGQLDFLGWADANILDEGNWANNEPDVRSIPRAFPGGWSLTFDHSHEYIGIRNVRRALTHAINRWSSNEDRLPPNIDDEVAEDFLESTTTPTPVMIENQRLDHFLGDRLDDYEPYGYGRDPDQMGESEQRAVDLLEEEGFERDDGEWYTPDGDRWEIEIDSPPAFVPWGESIAGQLRRFGIEMSFREYDPASFWGVATEEPFELRMLFWSDQEVDTYWNFEFQASTAASWAHLDEVHGVSPGDDDYALNIEIPFPIGDPDGTIQTVDLWQKTRDLRTAGSEEEYRELMQELAWIHNQFLIMVPIHLTVTQFYLATDNWIWPDEDSIYNQGLNGASHGLPWLHGEVRARTE